MQNNLQRHYQLEERGIIWSDTKCTIKKWMKLGVSQCWNVVFTEPFVWDIDADVYQTVSRKELWISLVCEYSNYVVVNLKKQEIWFICVVNVSWTQIRTKGCRSSTCRLKIPRYPGKIRCITASWLCSRYSGKIRCITKCKVISVPGQLAVVTKLLVFLVYLQ